MELSEDERRRLAQLEAALAADDPKLANTLGRSALGGMRQVKGRRAGLAGLLFVFGVLAVIGGMSSHWLVSVLGFLVMVVSTVYALNAWRVVEDTSGKPAGPRQNPEFMGRMEERWNRRQQGDN